MPEVAELLGQRRTAERLAADLVHRSERLVRLTGPPGSGKSTIALRVAATWVAGGGHCLLAEGDAHHSSRLLYPLQSGLAHGNPDWLKLAAEGTRMTLDVAGKFVPVGGIGTSIFDLLRASARQRSERALRSYDASERDVLLDLKRLAQAKPLLIVADSAHWWDETSLRLLADVISERLREAIPQLGSIDVLMVDTVDEQPAVAPEAFAALAEMCQARTQRTAGCTRAAFPAVLQAFGLEHPLGDDVLDALFSVTNGHLKLAEQVAAYVRHDRTGALLTPIDSGYVSALLTARFDSLGAFSPEVTELLIRAAILGLSFTEQDLRCIADERRASVQDLVERAESIGFIARDAQQIAFSHDVIRSAILGAQTPSQLRVLYGKLAECLALLRPGDYAARAQAQLRAGDTERAQELAALAAVQQLRRGASAARVLGGVGVELAPYVEKLAAAYSAVGTGDFAAAIRRLGTTSPGESTLMAAERNYLLALCSMELQTAAGFADALTTVNTWITSVDGELELRVRFLLLLQQAQVLAERFDEARATEAEVERQLVQRARHDPEAAVALQIQNRRAAAVKAPEVAEHCISDAVAFFRHGTHDTSRDQLELYRSLNNLAAVQLRLGKDAEAHVHAEGAERIALDSPEGVQRLDVSASNMVLACHRSGLIDAGAAVVRQRQVVESPDGADDKFIHRCNLVAYLLLDAQDPKAAEELRRLEDELESREFEESYLVFYCGALSVALAVLAGDVDGAIDRHARMGAFVESLKWPAAAYVRRRQRLLANLLPTVRPDGPRAIADRVLLDAYPSEVGPAWPYYGRLVPCSELSFWSDS